MPENMSLAVFDPHAAMVADLVEKNKAQHHDITTEAGEKALRSWVHRIKGARGDLERARKATKADALAFGKKIDARAKELDAPLVEMITENMKPLDEIEAKNRADAEAIVAAEEAAKAEKADAEQKELEEFRAKAQAQQEKEAAEKAEKEQAEREKRIAEETAKRAEDAARDAALKAIREKNEAIDLEREKARKELQRIKDEADKIAADLVVEQDRIAKEALAKVEKEAKIEADRVADVEHRRRIETSIHKAIWDAIRSVEAVGEANFNQLAAVKVRDAIKEGLIPNVTINY